MSQRVFVRNLGGTPIVVEALVTSDYEEGDWVPSVSFSTPGDLNVAYGVLRTGKYVRIVNWVWIAFQLGTTTWTHATASGYLRITGLPFPVRTDGEGFGIVQASGISAADCYFTMDALGGSSELVGIKTNNTGTGSGVIDTTNAPSGTNIALQGSLGYFID